MDISSKVLVGLVASLHLYTMHIEMIVRENKGRKAFKGILPAEVFAPAKNLASNLGLYNGFLAAGLIWTLFIGNQDWQQNITIFLLSCIVVAGVYEAITGSKKYSHFRRSRR